MQTRRSPNTTPPEVSVVVPVYSATTALPLLLSEIDVALGIPRRTFELILVDDRGNPASWEAITELARTDPRVIGVRLSRNFGQHAATLCGVAHARGTFVVTMDEDLEHPPEAIPFLLDECSRSQPLVYGVFSTRTHGLFRNFSSEAMRWTLKKAFPEMNQSYTSFRAMHGSLASELTNFESSRPYVDGILSWLTSSVGTVPVLHGKRESGPSSYTLKKLVSHAINIFVTFSSLPLRIATVTGIFLATASFLYFLMIIYQKMSGRIADPGYASLMSVILFACGVQLVMLGVIGEYIGRLLAIGNRKPAYAVAMTTPVQGEET